MTQEAHERVKRSQLEPVSVKAKRMRTIPPLETLPDEVVCVRPLDTDVVPVVMFSQVDNLDGLARTVT